jgi:hypothetical protein
MKLKNPFETKWEFKITLQKKSDIILESKAITPKANRSWKNT